jgi:hypothetical protein
MRRLILAALCGTLVSAVLLTASLLAADERALTIVRTLYGVPDALQTFVFVLGYLLVFGALPAIALGGVLMFFRRASPITLVLTPAILFTLTLGEVAREMREVSLVTECLPAMIVGGAAMFLILSRGRIQQPVEAVFE